MRENSYWILEYSKRISQSFSVGFVEVAAAWLRPICVMAALSLHPTGYRAVVPLVFLRGFLMAYCFSAFWVGDCDVYFMLFAGMTVLPVYYILARCVYFRWDRSDDRVRYY